MGMDGFAFTLGQKLVVFATDEHNRPAGEFSLRDAWFMDLFARRIALAAASKLDAARAHVCSPFPSQLVALMLSRTSPLSWDSLSPTSIPFH
mmetsp:Transcript_48518/g.105233  ORF Transcript_48518/g.105233 Transcript_48518/m.105233 type:complete len:92 (+) Transcript_48518:197-472(+)